MECTALGASRNGLEQYRGRAQRQRACTCGPGTIDVVVANPPYYAGFRIARFFLETGHAALRRGGRIFVVTKRPEWYAEHMPRVVPGRCHRAIEGLLDCPRAAVNPRGGSVILP